MHGVVVIVNYPAQGHPEMLKEGVPTCIIANYFSHCMAIIRLRVALHAWSFLVDLTNSSLDLFKPQTSASISYHHLDIFSSVWNHTFS